MSTIINEASNSSRSGPADEAYIDDPGAAWVIVGAAGQIIQISMFYQIVELEPLRLFLRDFQPRDKPAR